MKYPDTKIQIEYEQRAITIVVTRNINASLVY